MRLALWLVSVATAALICACGSPEQPPAKPSTPVATAPAQPPAAPPPAPVISKEAPKPAAPVAAEAAKPAAAPAASEATKPAATPAKPAPPPAAAKPSKPAAVADTLILPASQGKVTLHHLGHAQKFPCATCHGEATPGKLKLTKETAHALCRDCHQAKGAGPTGCSGCHQK